MQNIAGAGVREGYENVGRGGGFEEGPKWCFSRGRRRDFGFAKSMFEVSDAESVEGLQISCHGSVALQGSFRMAVTRLRVCIPGLNFFVAGAILLKHPFQNR